MNSAKSVIKGALLAILVSTFIPIWPYMIFNRMDTAYGVGSLLCAILSLNLSWRAGVSLQDLNECYVSDFILLAFVGVLGGAISLFYARKSWQAELRAHSAEIEVEDDGYRVVE